MYKPSDTSRRQRCAYPNCGYTWDPSTDGKDRADGHADVPARKDFHVCGDVIRADEDYWPDGGPWANLGPCTDGSACGMPTTHYVPVGDVRRQSGSDGETVADSSDESVEGWAVVLCTRHGKALGAVDG